MDLKKFATELTNTLEENERLKEEVSRQCNITITPPTTGKNKRT